MNSARRSKMILGGSINKALVLLAMPLMLANLLKSLHDIIDTVFLGGIEGSVSAQTAVAYASPILLAMLAVPLGISIGMTATVSGALGARQWKRAENLITAGFALGLIFSLVLVPVTMFACPLLLPLFGQSSATALAADYLRLRALEIPAVMMFEIFRGIRQAQGETKTAMLLASASLILNVALTIVMINLGFGAAGAATATVISQWAIVPVCLLGTFRSKKFLTARIKAFLKSLPETLPLLKVCMPVAASGILASMGFLVLQWLIRTEGDNVIAAFSIVNRLTNVLVVPLSSLGSVLTTMIGQNIGAKNTARAEECYTASRDITLAIMTVLGGALFLLSRFILPLFSNDAEVVTVAGEYMIWAAATLPLLGLFQNYCGAYNGYGKTLFTFLLESCRLWALRLPLVLLLTAAIPLGRAGIWYAMVISNVIICIIGRIFLSIVRRKSAYKYKTFVRKLPVKD